MHPRDGSTTGRGLHRTPHPIPARAPDGPDGPDVLVVDCDLCVLDGTAACEDCVVTWLVDRTPGTAVVIEVAEVRALRALEHGGLVPALRHRRRSGPDGSGPCVARIDADTA